MSRCGRPECFLTDLHTHQTGTDGIIAQVCVHGSLARSCYVCELESERDALKAELAKNAKAFEDRGHAFQDTCSQYQAEISKLKAELACCDKYAKEQYQAYIESTKEIESARLLKAEMDNLSCPHCGSDVDGTNWKSRAAKYREALEKMNCCGLVGCSDLKHRPRCPEGIAKEALQEAEA